MKQKILLSLFIGAIGLSVHAQKSTAYAITGVEKGQNSWTEVRLIDLTTGEELKTIYQNSQEPELLNARTGKPVVKKDVATNDLAKKNVMIYSLQPATKDATNTIQQLTKTYVRVNVRTQTDKPFSTYSAACAYDKKHDRLYYTPMGINQLRYIDLKSDAKKIFYFEDEPFGALTGRGDVSNQITRMVIGADGDIYSLTNNADHLIKVTTNKKATITDMGALADDAANTNNSVHSPSGYGGDMIASKSGELYLITASHAVFKIDTKSMVATFKGLIQGLPRGFSTNGAAVEEGTKVIVASSNSTSGYYRFDMNTLVAEKVANQGSVYNASDLANSNLLTAEKKKKDVKEPETPQPLVDTKSVNPLPTDVTEPSKVSIYPNPVTSGSFKLSFDGFTAGKYQAQLVDLNGKLVSSQSVILNYKTQVSEFKLPALIAKGNYMVNIIDESNKVISTNKLIVE